jgi:hypothetical protein
MKALLDFICKLLLFATFGLGFMWTVACSGINVNIMVIIACGAFGVVMYCIGRWGFPIPYAISLVAITAFQIVFSVLIHSHSNLGTTAILLEKLLYILLAVDLCFALLILTRHLRMIKKTRNFIDGHTFKLVGINSGNSDKANVNSTIIVFDSKKKRGKCVDFYGIKDFTYKIDPQVMFDIWADGDSCPNIVFRYNKGNFITFEYLLEKKIIGGLDDYQLYPKEQELTHIAPHQVGKWW